MRKHTTNKCNIQSSESRRYNCAVYGEFLQHISLPKKFSPDWPDALSSGETYTTNEKPLAYETKKASAESGPDSRFVKYVLPPCKVQIKVAEGISGK